VANAAAAATGPVPPALLFGLTAEQREAVSHGQGPLLVFAGPGAGKTGTLTRRVAYLLARGQAQPRDLLVVTFTIAAASELRLRLVDLIGEAQVRGLAVGTFHATCARLIRRHAPAVGRSERYTIHDQTEAEKLARELLHDGRRAELRRELEHVGEAPVRDLLREISLAKNRLLDPDGYLAQAGYPAAPLARALWRALDQEYERCDALGFDDLLVGAVRILTHHEQLRASYRRRWRYVLVDEMQDTNHAQMALLCALCAPEGNLTVVGDDDQATYRWRGAEPDNLLHFRDHFPTAQTVMLGRNFRSCTEIVAPAARLITHNQRRAPKRLMSVGGAGGRTEVRAFANEHAEAWFVAEALRGALDGGTPGRELMVVARDRHAFEPTVNALTQAGVPHRVLGALGLFERAEIRDAIAHLQLVSNPFDALAFTRAACVRPGVGQRSTAAVRDYARATGRDLIAAAQEAHRTPGLRRAARDPIRRMGVDLDRARREMWQRRSIAHIVIDCAMSSGGPVRVHQHKRDHAASGEERRDAERVLEDLRSLCRAAERFEQDASEPVTLGDFLEFVAGLGSRELEGQDQRVTVSSIHRAKGREAEAVFLVGCEDGRLPGWRALESPDRRVLEEERRLCYVAFTRARRRLTVSWAAERYGRDSDGPSRFIAEAGL